MIYTLAFEAEGAQKDEAQKSWK